MDMFLCRFAGLRMALYIIINKMQECHSWLEIPINYELNFYTHFNTYLISDLAILRNFLLKKNGLYSSLPAIIESF